MDTASSEPVDLDLSLQTGTSLSADPESRLDAPAAAQWDIPNKLAEELWLAADGNACGITQSEFSIILTAVGAKYNHGLPFAVQPDPAQKEAFYRALRLPDLCLAQACALGRDAAWQRFLALYRESITRAAVAITGSSTIGNELADSLYSELYGLKEQGGRRISPLASYSGRGSLLAWLRTTLAQRHIDRYRRTHREAPLDDLDLPTSPPAVLPVPDEISLLTVAVFRTLEALDPEGRFLLSSYFLDRRTLLEIARLLKVHEATISRRLKRLIADLRKQLLKNLQSHGLSARKAEEALGVDPRDIEINMRLLLQTSQTAAFTDQTKDTGPTPP